MCIALVEVYGRGVESSKRVVIGFSIVFADCSFELRARYCFLRIFRRIYLGKFPRKRKKLPDITDNDSYLLNFASLEVRADLLAFFGWRFTIRLMFLRLCECWRNDRRTCVEFVFIFTLSDEMKIKYLLCRNGKTCIREYNTQQDGNCLFFFLRCSLYMGYSRHR